MLFLSKRNNIYAIKYDPQNHRRRSIRLNGFDYSSPGAYFVTICMQNRECILHDPALSGIIKNVWQGLPGRFPTIALDEFIIMPNHIHFILWLGVGAPLAGAQDASTRDAQGSGAVSIPRAGACPAPTLGDVVGAFKSLVFRDYLDWVEINDPSRTAKFWQRNYYEHIIRNDRELDAIRQYILDNPVNWEMDRDNLNNLRQMPPPEKAEEYLKDIEEMIGIAL